MPKRIKLERKKGWKLPKNAKKVDRSTRWGNPFKVGKSASGFSIALPKVIQNNYEAVEAYKYYLQTWLLIAPNCVHELRGKDLACWCKLDEYCHADVLLEVANAKTKAEKREAVKNIYE